MKYLACFLYVLFVTSTFGQANLDSLRAVWNDHNDADTSRLKAIGELAKNYINHADSALYFRQLQYELAESKANKQWMAIALEEIGLIYKYKGNYAQAMDYLTRSLKINEEIGDKKQIALSFNNLGLAYSEYGDYAKAQEYYARSLEMSEKIGDKKQLGSALTNTGLIYFEQGDYTQAMEYFIKSLKIQQETGDNEGMALTLDYIGWIYLSQNDFAQAMEYLTRSLKIKEENEDKPGIARSLIQIGWVYRDQGDYVQAMEYLTRSLRLKEEIGDKKEIAAALNNIAFIYQIQGNDAQAIDYFSKVVEISEEIGDKKWTGIGLVNLGFVYLNQGGYDQTLEYFMKALEISEEAKDKKDITNNLINVGLAYEKKGNFIEAISYGTRALALAQEVGSPQYINEATEGLYRSYKATGRYQQSLAMHELHISMRDSLNNEANQRAVLQQQYKYLYERKSLADSLQAETVKAETEALYQKNLARRNYLLYGGLSLAMLAFVFFRYRIQRKARAREFARERERAERLEQIDHLKDQFLANTSHELRTPLHGIIGLTEGLIDQVADQEQKHTLAMVVASGKRLASLVNDLLDFSRIKNADLVLRQRPVDLHAVADMVLQVSAPLTQGKELRLINEIPATFPPAFADEDRLTQILYNLVGNAVKFTERGTIVVGISGHQYREGIMKEAEGFTTVFVKDTGTGIPENKQEAIFEAFIQADGSISREFAGTGLGLSVSKTLVEQHGGQMWVASKLGEGSTFFFTLPVSHKKVVLKDNAKTTIRLSPLLPFSQGEQAVAIPIAPTTGKIRLLVVDDEPVNHQVLKNHLRDDRYEVVSAMNGKEATELLDKGTSFDLVLLDVMMPRMSGYQVCEHIRKKFLASELPVIMVTAKNQVSDLVKGLNTGANDYLAKPFSKEEFLARLSTHLNLHRINQATSRFVPSEFIKTLGRNTITEVRLGDNIAKEVTVFFSDIRGYTSLAEKMSPEENFRFVNAYASRMGPVIQANHGFVNQFLGDGIMALFQQSPADAVRAAIGMQAEVRQYNIQRISQGRQPIQVGMGFHTGTLVMGIIGDALRSDAAIIADTVNAAARLEGLTKYYKANILLSEISYQVLAPEIQSHCRYLGLVQLKGKEKPIGIYECLDGEEEKLRDLKLASRDHFEAGLQAYLQGKVAAAISAFATVLAQNPEDGAASYFLHSVQQLRREGVPKGWTGVVMMDGK